MVNLPNELTKRRGHLPHWELGGSTYFITFTSVLREFSFQERELIRTVILKGTAKQFQLYFGVIMHNHVHLLLLPLQDDNGAWYLLSHIMKGIKGASSRMINTGRSRTGSVWLQEYMDRIIRNDDEYYKTVEYIWLNPIRAGLVKQGEEYKYYVYPSGPLDKNVQRTASRKVGIQK